MFQPPRNNYSDFSDQAKFRLTWNLNMLLVIILLLIAEIFVVVEPRFVPHYFVGVVLTGGGLLYMRKKRRFRPVAIVSSITSFLLVSSSIFFIKDAPHFIEPFWLLNITFYVFFVLGYRWGLGFLIAQILVVGFYLVTMFQTNLVAVLDFSKMRFATMAIEFAVCLLLLGYIIYQFIVANRYAEEKYKLANNLAIAEKNIVDRQNKEKTALLQEIHHRVKNNLQVVTSLLRLQSDKVTSDEARENFQDAINRIMTMALIHQKMYEDENLANIDLEDYFSALVNDLVLSNTSNKTITLDLQIEIEKVGNKSMVPVALIITELVSNSLKHAFKNKDEGIIGLQMKSLSGDRFEMNYYDNGEWILPKTSSSLGLELIETFTEQLDGEMSFDNSGENSSYRFELCQIEEE